MAKALFRTDHSGSETLIVAPRLLSRVELAAELGVNAVTITKWQGEGLPVAVRGGRGRESKYRMADVWQWGLARERQRAGAEADGPVNLAVERAKLARAQTRRQELEVRRREGELVEAAEVGRLWGLIVAAIRTKLLALPASAAPRLASLETPAALEQELGAAVRDVLRELAAWREPESPPAAQAGG